MGLDTIANNLAAEGRGNDSMLVHMTPNEVASLQALAKANGGELTTNPETGLPEAGFLDSILPVVAGAGLAMIPGVGPLMAAGLVGGGTALFTGSLEKGLMAGLGAFGGAGLGSALTSAGAAAATAPAATGTVPGLTAAGSAGAAAAAPSTAFSAVPGTATAGIKEALLAGSPSAGAFTPAAATTVAPSVAPSFTGNLANAATGFQNLGSEAGRGAFMESVGGLKGLAKSGGAAAAPMLASGLGMGEEEGLEPKQTYIRPFKYDAGYQGGSGLSYRTGAPGESTAELSYFKPKFTPVGVYKAGEEPEYGSYAGGGLTAFAKGGSLPPRYLNGDGDGMSDSIKANIDGQQEARLADGEFVIPADVVSHLGNGSSNAGAKRLHTMMNRIRQARTGKAKQAPEVDADKFLPA